MKDLSNLNEEALKNFAYEFSMAIKKNFFSKSKPFTVFLKGTLGVGKTTFSKHLILGLLPHLKEEEITSPTFNLVKTYEDKKIRVAHFDLYRLAQESSDILFSLEEIGFQEYLKNYNLCIIEWSEFLPKNFHPLSGLCCELFFEFNPSNKKNRSLKISAEKEVLESFSFL